MSRDSLATQTDTSQRTKAEMWQRIRRLENVLDGLIESVREEERAFHDGISVTLAYDLGAAENALEDRHPLGGAARGRWT